MSVKLIITADDYGMSDSVNEGIEACLSAGAMKATCVMANMPECDAASDLREKYPHASIGLHWNLTEGKPILPTPQVTTLVDSGGTFLKLSQLRKRVLRKQINYDELRAELTAQYQRVYDLVGSPDFWNTHQHVHYWPFLYGFLIKLGIDLKIPAIRNNHELVLARDPSPMAYFVRRPTHAIKDRIISLRSRVARGQGVVMPDGLLHLVGYGRGNANLLEALVNVPRSFVGKTVECVIHPATAIIPNSIYGSSRLDEYSTFSNAQIVDQLAALGVETMSFSDILAK